jgi:hypothetical protein
VLPIKRAEELLATLPGVIAARIIAGQGGAVDEIHVLTSADVPPKQTVRNIESALIAHLGMRVDHRKISVATTAEPAVAREASAPREAAEPAGAEALSSAARRHLYFQDVEVRRSRQKGIAVRVTLTKGEQSLVGEAEGVESDRSRIELAARAALIAVQQSEPAERPLALDGARQIDAFDRQFVFVTVTARLSRSTLLLTGSCEIKDSAETASVLAVLDATNRWLSGTR